VSGGAELTLRLPIWLALVAGCLACVGVCPRRSWRWGAVALAVHVVAAFHWVHGWSHAAAYAATADQVRAAVGGGSGAGLWVNYAFLIAWIGVAWRWDRCPVWVRTAWQVTFAFMAFNGAVVFAHGYARLWGGLLTVVTLAGWVRQRRLASRLPALIPPEPEPGKGP
jgi:hypothetical protein